MVFASDLIPFNQYIAIDLTSKSKMIKFNNLKNILEENKVDYIVSSLSTQNNKLVYDYNLSTKDWSSFFNSKINISDSEEQIEMELNYSSHLNLKYSFISYTNRLDFINRLYVITSYLTKGSNLVFKLILDSNTIKEIKFIINSFSSNLQEQIAFSLSISQVQLTSFEMKEIVSYNIRFFSIQSSSFIIQDADYVLSDNVEQLVRSLLYYEVDIIINDDI